MTVGYDPSDTSSSSKALVISEAQTARTRAPETLLVEDGKHWFSNIARGILGKRKQKCALWHLLLENKREASNYQPVEISESK